MRCIDSKWWNSWSSDFAHCWHDYEPIYKKTHGDGTITEHKDTWKMKCCWCNKITDKPNFQ